jgi:methylthioribose-1-phosphate isomerase
MPRVDDGLAFMLKYENVAWYQDKVVKILDRRVYPREVKYVECRDYREVAQAIADMVTQSGGPWLAAQQALVMTAYQVQDQPSELAKAILREAATSVTRARPTTSERMAAVVQKVLHHAEAALDRGEPVGPSTEKFVFGRVEATYQRARAIGENVVALLPEKVTILTQCYAEWLIGFTLLVCQERDKDVSLICPETRPYLQGARLAASVAHDMGVPVTVITDNMPGYLLSRRIPDAFICAADVITLDGHVVNKIGTYQIALAAHANQVPFYVLGTPSAENETIDSVRIEERDSQEVLHVMGQRTAMKGVKGYYPAFDITPPNLVGAVVTEKGVYSPFDLKRFGNDVRSN